MSSDIKIARAHKMLHIEQIAHKLNIDSEDLELYGKYKAKVPLNYKKNQPERKGRLFWSLQFPLLRQEKARQQSQLALPRL